MGSGSWTAKSFVSYSTSQGRDVDDTGNVSGDYTAQDMFKSYRLDSDLNPKNVIRECCDSEEHPNTIPVILGLDVTGSMGPVAVEVAKKLNTVMTELYDEVDDVEFLIMGIGDLYCDHAPIQASQFESDIRIAEQLDKIYFEAGGGGNNSESYTSAWYFGLRHTKLDCWDRGKKGIIITTGDEPLNTYLPQRELSYVTGDTLEGDIETKALYDEASEKFDIYHLAVNDKNNSYSWHEKWINSTFPKYLDDDHFKVVGLDNIVPTIIDIVKNASNGNAKPKESAVYVDSESGMISW